MYSPPYVNPSFARACRHYECIGGCGGGGSTASRSSRPSQLAAAQQRAEQLSHQQRLIRAALYRAAPLTTSRRDGGWSERAEWPAVRGQDRLLLADARRAAKLLRQQEQELEQEWRQEQQRQERERERQEMEWERENAARRRGGRQRRQPTPAWEEEGGYCY